MQTPESRSCSDAIQHQYDRKCKATRPSTTKRSASCIGALFERQIRTLIDTHDSHRDYRVPHNNIVEAGLQ